MTKLKEFGLDELLKPYKHDGLEEKRKGPTVAGLRKQPQSL